VLGDLFTVKATSLSAQKAQPYPQPLDNSILGLKDKKFSTRE